ncbi:radical SAM protein [Desulfobacterales bacterium HSG17]|nr:radical SAM protein [Desulfobacterales bacterium HSG17]
MNFQNKDISIELNVHGDNEYTKVSYPVKYGLFSRLETNDYVFEFNQNHEIRHAKSRTNNWRHPSEWLKRTIGNDWIYYSTGGYAGVFEAIGEYYLPNLMYQTNSLLGGLPFKDESIDHIVKNWHEILMSEIPANLPDHFMPWLKAVQDHTPDRLEKKAEKLFNITGSRVSVMPPDARHVDYNIIPVNISDGCLYKCRFCKIKNHKKFNNRPIEDIDRQFRQIKQLYNNDIVNFNALFLGEHDALNASCDLILETVQKAYHTFNFKNSYMSDNYLFIFGSADSFLNKDAAFFKRLNQLDFQTFINIGLESFDQKVLDMIGKPISEKKVGRAFKKIQSINNAYNNIEITCNFVMDENLPDSHHNSLMTLIRNSVNRTNPKGSIYLSPLKFGSPSREVLYDFYKLKALSRFPTFLYIIQRL